MYNMQIPTPYTLEKRPWEVLDKAKLVGGNFCQGKNNYKNDGIFHGFFLAPKKILSHD